MQLNENDDTATAESVLEQLRTQVGAGLETASEELKRDVVKLLVRRIEIHREEIRIVYKVPQNPFDRRPETRGSKIQTYSNRTGQKKLPRFVAGQ